MPPVRLVPYLRPTTQCQQLTLRKFTTTAFASRAPNLQSRARRPRERRLHIKASNQVKESSILPQAITLPATVSTNKTSGKDNSSIQDSMQDDMRSSRHGATGADGVPDSTFLIEEHQGRNGIEIVQDVATLRRIRRAVSSRRSKIGLVPTMGALHDGHLDLVREAARECEYIILSIYVNPTQFGVNEDLSSYPRTMEADMAKLNMLNAELQGPEYIGKVRVAFHPTTETMYPVGLDQSSHVIMHPSITKVLEGSSRPNFFQGVSTVVTKLLNIVQPDRVYFGQKDIQQLIVVQRMISEFHLPTQLRCIATRRHEDGLAMSSRNVYLGQRRRALAISLFTVLSGARNRYLKGKYSRQEILQVAIDEAAKIREAQSRLPPNERALFEVDYLSLADPIYLRELDSVDSNVGAILSGAIVMLPLEDPQPNENFGLGDDKRSVRLIDNILLGQANNIGHIES